MDTLNEALAKRKDVHGLILHSDQGFQYTSNEYKTICAGKDILISMSAKGTPVDNSPIENWHSLLKKEVLYNNNITSLSQYITLVEDWIEFYNTSRISIINIHRQSRWFFICGHSPVLIAAPYSADVVCVMHYFLFPVNGSSSSSSICSAIWSSFNWFCMYSAIFFAFFPTVST